MELLSPNVGFAEFLRSRAPIRGFENVTPPFGGGRFCPLQVLTRDMSAGVFSQGGALISSSVGDFTAPLRANSAVLKSGAQLKTGLVPPVGFPVGGNDLVASFVSEYATAVESDFSFSTAKMTPHRVVTQMTVSNQLLMQGTGDIAALFSAQAVLAIDAAIDKNCFVGGGGAAPLGLFNTPGIQRVTLGGPVSLSSLLQFEELTGLANAEGPNANLGWVQSPSTRLALKGRQKFTQGSDTLENDRGYIIGYPSVTTTELSGTNQLLFCNFSYVMVGWFFQGIFVLEDMVTKAQTSETVLTISAFVDFGITHPTAAIISTDVAQ